MKNLAAALVILFGAISLAAKDLSFGEMPAVLANLDSVGTSGAGYTCAIKTEWLENGNLKVFASETYKNMNSNTLEMVLTPVKRMDVYSDQYDGLIDYVISQSTTLHEEGDYRVELIELFSFQVKGKTIVSAQVQVLEADFESDPHDESISCHFTN